MNLLRLPTLVLQIEIIDGNFPEVAELHIGVTSKQGF